MDDCIRVLHVEDEPGFAEMAAGFLERQDDRFEIETASDVEEALGEIDSRSYDCVVSDYDLPDLNGIEFLEEVRREDPELPFILYTGKGSEEIASEAISAGVTDYLQKETGTSQYEVLANRILNSVEKRRASQEVDETRRKLSEIAEKSDDVLFMFDGDWDELLFVNSAYEEIWGGSIEELEEDSQAFLDLIHPEDREGVLERMERVSQGERVSSQYRVVRPDGSVRYVAADTRPILEDGEVTKVVGYTRDVTDRVERRQKIQEERRRFQSLAETLSQVVYRADPDTLETLYVNDSIMEQQLYTPAELTENPELWRESLHPDDRERVIESFREAREDAEGSQLEYRIETKDGEVRWMRDTFGWQTDEDGDVEALVGVMADVTEEVERRRRYEAVFHQTYQFTGLTEPDGTVIEVNDTALEFGGIEREDVLGEKLWDAYWVQIDQETRERVREIVEKAQDGELVRGEMRVQGSDDDAFIDYSLRPITDEDGETTLMVAEGRDITERVERERELEKKTRYLEAISEYTARPMFMKDSEDRYLFVNDEYLRLFDLEEDEVIGSTDEEIHPKGMSEYITDNDRRVVEEGESIEAEEHVEVDGEKRTYLSSKTPLYFDDGDDEDGEADAVFGIATDITDRERHQRELERMNERLKEFAGVVSHDLQNPLAVAKGRVELAKDDGDSHLEHVESSLERMERIIDDMHWLTQHGRSIGERSEVSLKKLVEEAWTQVATHEATVENEVDGSTDVDADHHRVLQMMENLFVNAVDHAGPDCRVTVGEIENGFYVEDDGPGVPADETEEVFEAGYTTSEEGTGFGLSIVREIAEAHGWKVELMQADDGGARFEFQDVEPS